MIKLGLCMITCHNKNNTYQKRIQVPHQKHEPQLGDIGLDNQIKVLRIQIVPEVELLPLQHVRHVRSALALRRIHHTQPNTHQIGRVLLQTHQIRVRRVRLQVLHAYRAQNQLDVS